MALRSIRTDGDPILRKQAKPVVFFDQKLHTLLDDMAETMIHSVIGVGLAAPQVGVLRQVIICDLGNGKMEMVNPEITARNGSVVEVEGCLSVPHVYGKVERPASVRVSYRDRDGTECVLDAEGFLAVVISHEMDHLQGVLFTDKAIQYIDTEEYAKSRRKETS